MDRRTDRLTREFVQHVEAAIERGEYRNAEHCAEVMLECEVPAKVVADVIRRGYVEQNQGAQHEQQN